MSEVRRLPYRRPGYAMQYVQKGGQHHDSINHPTKIIMIRNQFMLHLRVITHKHDNANPHPVGH